MDVTKWLKPSVSVSRYTVTARVCRPFDPRVVLAGARTSGYGHILLLNWPVRMRRQAGPAFDRSRMVCASCAA